MKNSEIFARVATIGVMGTAAFGAFEVNKTYRNNQADLRKEVQETIDTAGDLVFNNEIKGIQPTRDLSNMDGETLSNLMYQAEVQTCIDGNPECKKQLSILGRLLRDAAIESDRKGSVGRGFGTFFPQNKQ